MVGIYNRGMAEDLEFLDRLRQEPGTEEPKPPITIDLAVLAEQSSNPNNALLTSLVDMAKTGALTYLSDTYTALDLVERHIRPNDRMWE